MFDFSYTNSLSGFSRFHTSAVNVGSITIGGLNPVRIQSMTNTNTKNIDKTVNQTIDLIKNGCELVRITAPGVKDAELLYEIKQKIRKLGYETPIIADIHFNPKAAEVAAKNVEKVRINPGNYSDSKNEEKITFTIEEYNQELTEIKNKLEPLVQICKKNNTVIRIGVNHGSLSSRIMSRYGDSPEGMVQSALEYLEIFRQLDFHNIILSLKSSNTRVMIHSYRILVQKMKESEMNYPLHLGVTEAGDSEEGRIKSAVGIGALLADGIGDTIRVSLTEDPVAEIPVAKKIVEYFEKRETIENLPGIPMLSFDPYSFQRRKSFVVNSIGGNNLPVVIANYSKKTHSNLSANKLIPEFVFVDNSIKKDPNLSNLNSKVILKENISNDHNTNTLKDVSVFLKTENFNPSVFVLVSLTELSSELFNHFKKHKNSIIVIDSISKNAPAEWRYIINEFIDHGVKNPIILKKCYNEDNLETFWVKTACDFGLPFIDGLADGIWIENKGKISYDEIISCSFTILQACRVRMSKTEFISCPSCGRTNFDIYNISQEIKQKTSHLKGLKIGIMGCIVNGPGEMADSDYGYIGSGIGKVTLYKSKEVVKKNIPSDEAVDALINLIKENDDWKDV